MKTLKAILSSKGKILAAYYDSARGQEVLAFLGCDCSLNKNIGIFFTYTCGRYAGLSSTALYEYVKHSGFHDYHNIL